MQIIVGCLVTRRYLPKRRLAFHFWIYLRSCLILHLAGYWFSGKVPRRFWSEDYI